MDEVRFSDKGIIFVDYPFAPASVSSGDPLPWDKICEVDPDAWPPELRLETGEVLFVAAEQKEELRQACKRYGVPVVQRVDVWALLLEPFLDTEFDEEHEERTLRRLEEYGITREEAWKIRREVRRRMLAYNFVMWDWVHLGLYDLLQASPAQWFPGLSWLRRGASQRFYWWAMEIAGRGPVVESVDEVGSASSDGES